MDSYLPPHIYLGSWQTTSFRNKILGTLGDALIWFFYDSACCYDHTILHKEKAFVVRSNDINYMFNVKTVLFVPQKYLLLLEDL